MSNPIYTTHSTTTMAMTATVDTKGTKRRRPHPGRMERYRRQIHRLQAENDLLHARLAMIYDALSLTPEDLTKETQ
ncbi:hypothetical protein [Bifidobacterium cuniculi]|uniref:Uncharacterized protein n=1 Tax=Bifidobacterium cuniculi TaxID=1688 RepID=A0A087AHS1_9BIFI|nr:hypothetical protein [Bifidobacterium cuniculi]KFI58321.1 hypothetical protein BCUN_1922 [Bifidobacterium cuniculi]